MTTTLTPAEATAVLTVVDAAVSFDSAVANRADIERLLAEAHTLEADRHYDVLKAIDEALSLKVSQTAIGQALKDAGTKFGKDLVGHAVRAYRVAALDQSDEVVEASYALRCTITNAASNWGVSLKDIDAAIKGLTSCKDAVEAVKALKDKGEDEVETDEDEDTDESDEGEGDEVVNDAARLVAIANILGGMEKDGTADAQAIDAIIEALEALKS